MRSCVLCDRSFRSVILFLPTSVSPYKDSLSRCRAMLRLDGRYMKQDPPAVISLHHLRIRGTSNRGFARLLSPYLEAIHYLCLFFYRPALLSFSEASFGAISQMRTPTVRSFVSRLAGMIACRPGRHAPENRKQLTPALSRFCGKVRTLVLVLPIIGFAEYPRDHFSCSSHPSSATPKVAETMYSAVALSSLRCEDGREGHGRRRPAVR